MAKPSKIKSLQHVRAFIIFCEYVFQKYFKLTATKTSITLSLVSLFKAKKNEQPFENSQNLFK